MTTLGRLPEWDHLARVERPEWVTVRAAEIDPRAGYRRGMIAERHPVLLDRLQRLVSSVRVGRPVRLRRQPEGQELDLDACIGAMIDLNAGTTPEHGLYRAKVRRHRDLSLVVLVDRSRSTADPVPAAGRTVMELARDAVLVLAEVGRW